MGEDGSKIESFIPSGRHVGTAKRSKGEMSWKIPFAWDTRRHAFPIWSPGPAKRIPLICILQVFNPPMNTSRVCSVFIFCSNMCTLAISIRTADSLRDLCPGPVT